MSEIFEHMRQTMILNNNVWGFIDEEAKNKFYKLLDEEDDINVGDIYGITILYMAIYYDSIDIINELIKRGVDVNLKEEDGFSPLHQAFLRGNLEVIELLIKNGADINAVSEYGTTPLILATKGGKYEQVKFLVENGANVYFEDCDGRDALWYALHLAQDNRSENSLDIVAYLIKCWKEKKGQKNV